jgi:molecular chaperone DnaK
VLRLVNEPTAASLAYGLDRLGEELRIAVIDFGGGTLDVTIMEFGKGVFEVRATSGDTRLGGTDMDQLVTQHIVERFRRDSGVDLAHDPLAMSRVHEAAEIAKIELSSSTTAHIALPYIVSSAGGPTHLEMDLTRTDLERLVRPVIERCRGPLEQALADAGVTVAQIERIVFVGGPTRMPAVRAFFEDIFGREAERGVDPMECVASGAAIQAGVLAGEVGDIVLVDVTPLTLGVETLGGVATSLIARNTPIPVEKTEKFTTAADMQTSVTVHVYQGERPMAADNTSLGQFNLDGIPPAPRGVPQIEVTFDIDASGILDVAARDTATGRTQSIRITGSTRLSAEERERMIREAEKHAEEDRHRREEADLLNSADAVCYQAERFLADLGDKLLPEVRTKLETALSETKKAVKSRNTQEASEKSEHLKRELQQAGATFYQPAPPPRQEQPQETVQPSEAGSRGKVVDAEYQEVGGDGSR